MGATVNLKSRLYCHFRRTGNGKTKQVIIELYDLGLKPDHAVLEVVPFSEWVEKERHWIAKCYEAGHPLKNISGFDTYKKGLLFTMRIPNRKNAITTVTATVTKETKEFIDRLACESVARTSDVVRHLIELGIKHFND